MADFRVQFEEIGQAFVKHYYAMFDDPNSRTNSLINLYLQEQCVQTFEGSKSAGVEQIKARLAGLTFQKIQRGITSVDCQPLSDGVLVVAMGQLKTDDDLPQSFHESFVLRSTPNGFFITNNIFRLVLHHN
ncbi:putative nuclear transport factor 2 [Hypsibius exemplaris]|uniref:NTF2-related export protein n=1 Tax=Hypsibius exemplaris TaxID=2072580 RepID=A0A9X6RNE0_HYPEX|nr:putative nuclear transport factor 2 [Hypsibius exemplaris]